MTVEEAILEETVTQALCLRVSADADPGALARVLTCFQTLNVVPRRVVAELGTTGMLYIRIDVTGLTEGHLSLIAAKVGQVPCVGNAYWHRLKRRVCNRHPKPSESAHHRQWPDRHHLRLFSLASGLGSHRSRPPGRAGPRDQLCQRLAADTQPAGAVVR